MKSSRAIIEEIKKRARELNEVISINYENEFAYVRLEEIEDLLDWILEEEKKDE